VSCKHRRIPSTVPLSFICYVMLCYVMLCYAMLCYVMLCYVYQPWGPDELLSCKVQQRKCMACSVVQQPKLTLHVELSPCNKCSHTLVFVLLLAVFHETNVPLNHYSYTYHLFFVRGYGNG